jgi:hypothetical protein
MVARGDLGVEMPWKCARYQKQTRARARRQAGGRRHADAGIDDHRAGADPRRVSDVSIAVFEGADAIMLSAVGGRRLSGRGGGDDEPHRHQVETDPTYAGIINAQRSDRKRPAPTPFRSPREPAETLKLSAITYTASGTPACAQRERPQVPIIALCDPQHGSPAVAAVGHALRRLSRCQRPRRHGRPRLPHRVGGRVRQAGRPRHHHGRRAAEDAGVHQHAAHRLCRIGRAGQPVLTPVLVHRSSERSCRSFGVIDTPKEAARAGDGIIQILIRPIFAG